MKHFEINGEKKRFVFSVRAIKDYLDSLNDAEETDNSIDEVLKWAFAGFKYGAKADNESFDLSKEKLTEYLDADFDLFNQIADHCRKQFQIFQTAVAGKYEPKDAKKKEKE